VASKRKKRSRRPVRLQWERQPAPPVEASGLVDEEIYSPAMENPVHGLLARGNNLDVMRSVSSDFPGGIDLVYIDPPYSTGRRLTGTSRAREENTPPVRSPGFKDSWADGIAGYLDMLAPRLEMIRDLLSSTGSIYVHIDWHAAHYVKVLMDEIFGEKHFQNEIAWCYREAVNSKKRWNRKHDIILFYTRGREYTFNYEEVLEPHSESTLRKYRHSDGKGPYRLMGRGLKDSPIRSARDVSPQWEKDHPELTFRHYLPPGRLPVDYWMIDIVNQAASERTGYPTQKPEALIEKIILASSNPGDVVADFFCGSGVVPAVASRLGRRWIACDSSTSAINVTRKRLLSSFTVHDAASPVQESLFSDDEKPDAPSGFRVCRTGATPALDDRCAPLPVTIERNNEKVSFNVLPESEVDNPRSFNMDNIDFIAVDPDYDGKILRPCLWAARGRKQKDFPPAMPELASPAKSLCAALATGPEGDEYFIVKLP